MKKFFKYCVATLLVVMCALTFAACSSGVSGKTYKFDDVEITYSAEGLSDAEKSIIDSTISTIKSSAKAGAADTTMTFNADGTVTSSSDSSDSSSVTYTQDGNTVKITSSGVTQDFTVDGSSLYYSATQTVGTTTITVKMIFKQA
jgi:hypothetical protein